jgi:TetR/AcrR family hemagglutinin/protease transcriptional regulator
VNRVQPASRLSRPQRQQQLLDCALAAFARDGIGRAGHAQVAELAGVSVPTVFKYYPTREALVDAVFDRVERTFLTLARTAHRGSRPSREAFHDHARGFIRIAREQPDVVKVWLEWSASIREDVWPRLLELEEKLNRILARTIQQDRDAPSDLTAIEAARAVHGVAHILAHMIFAPKRMPGDPEAFALNVVDALLGFREGPSKPRAMRLQRARRAPRSRGSA